MSVDTGTRRSWPRLVLTIPPETRDRLHELARTNYRDPRREAMRLLLEGIERERPKVPER